VGWLSICTSLVDQPPLLTRNDPSAGNYPKPRSFAVVVLELVMQYPLYLWQNRSVNPDQLAPKDRHAKQHLSDVSRLLLKAS
jgi:hypothetical protein